MSNNSAVAVALSGGVDSALTAALLVEQGYQVTAVHLQLLPPGCSHKTEKSQLQPVQEIAKKLKIPLKFLNYQAVFQHQVIEYFVNQYQAGLSPNPCVICNHQIKFGQLYDWIRAEGFDYLATGHYARTDNGQLLTALDEKKDQTYFLHRLNQEQLLRIKFPLGDLTKTEVKKQARKRGLATKVKTESQGVCFIDQAQTKEFLEEKLGQNPGPVVDRNGQVIGRHQGLWFYTIGQRHGFKLFAKDQEVQLGDQVIDSTQRPPLYVIGKNPRQNQLIVGLKKDTYVTELTINKLHLINPSQSLPDSVLVRIRHGGQLFPAQLQQDGQSARLNLEQAAQGVAAGQFAVLYRPHNKVYRCLGGGVLTT